MDEDLVSTLALCWRIERRDGVTIGLTAHDRDLELDGLAYRAAPGMTPSAVVRTSGLDADTMDVTGALNADAIREEDLLAGRWDGARVAVLAVDWETRAAPVPLGEGTIGAVETDGAMLTAELRGLGGWFDRPVVEETTPSCRAELGDRRCRVAMAARRHRARVTAIDGRVATVDIAEPVANAFGGAVLRWLSGANSGLEDAVALSSGNEVTLRRPPRFDGAGARVEIIEGCDKRLETCTGRFANAVNFRGEPFLPGIDLLTRYPGG